MTETPHAEQHAAGFLPWLTSRHRGRLVGSLLWFLLLGGVGVSLIVSHVKFATGAITTEGTIIRLIEQKSPGSGNSGYNYYPVIRYKTQTGQTLTAQWNVSRKLGKKSLYQVDDQVTVMYRPANPGEIKVVSVLSVYGAPLACFLGALAGPWVFLCGPRGRRTS